MFNLLIPHIQKFAGLSPDLIHSKLYDENDFYTKFTNDLKHCKKEVIIESPYITTNRMAIFRNIFHSLVARKVKVYVITRHPAEHDLSMQRQAEEEIRNFEMIGVQVLIPSEYNHRKLAILDRKILWEGSLNILSQNYSREIMRRIVSERHAEECFQFIKLGKYIY